MRSYEITITGKTPLLMHKDDLAWQEKVKAWEKDPKNNAKSVAGDDRTPAWRWIGSLYHDGSVIGLPSDAIMAALLGGGTMVKVPGGRGQKTFKSQTQSGMTTAEPYWPLLVRGGTIPMAKVEPLLTNDDFLTQQQTAVKLGFDLDVRRAKVGTSKHVRVRPVFQAWQATGTLHVWDDQITDDILNLIFYQAGRFHGLCEWRPSSKKPGPFGTFEATTHRLELVA